MVSSTAWLISGREPGGNSTSTTGPAMATTRPSFSSSVGSVMVMVQMLLMRRARGEVGRCSRVRAWRSRLRRRCGQRLGAADDLHDLGGDGVLAGPVHDAREAADELLGVVGGRLHGPLAGGVLGGGGVEQGGVDAGLDVAGQQRLEDGAGRRLELVAGLRPRSPSAPSPLSSSLSSGTSGRLHDLLEADRHEAGVDERAPCRPRRPGTGSTDQSGRSGGRPRRWGSR